MPAPLAPWTPLAELSELRSQLDRAYQQPSDGAHHTWMPAIDVERNKNHLIVRADIPGVRPDEVKIEAQDGVLTIPGKHEEREEQKGKTYLRRERRYGSFTRSTALPERVDPSNIKANTKDGVVEVTILLPSPTKKEPVTITPTAA